MESPQIKASIRAGPNGASVRHFTKGYDIPMFEDMLKHFPVRNLLESEFFHYDKTHNHLICDAVFAIDFVYN